MNKWTMTQRGQLMLPMIALLFLFGMFLVLYVSWARHVYWQMRMDAASDLTALSVAREEARVLNYLDSAQGMENATLLKAGLFGHDVGTMLPVTEALFEGWNTLLVRTMGNPIAEKALVMSIATTVARANGATLIPIPRTNIDFMLKPHAVDVVVLSWPPTVRHFSSAYFTRLWFPKKTNPQPILRSWWTVCHGTICSDGRARVWLDVDPHSILSNGGFPTDELPWYRRVGIEPFYPQFSARRVPRVGRFLGIGQ